MDNCVFCKILVGDIPKTSIYEDDICEVILDKFPETKGHALVLTKVHYANIFEVPEDVVAHIIKIAKKVAMAAKEAFPDMTGLNILQNNGTKAGQTVFHYHMHVIPRYDNDKITIHWNTNELTNDIMGQIKNKYINILTK